MKRLGNLKLILAFVLLTVVLTWLVILTYEQYLRGPFYDWVEARYPGDIALQGSIEQRVEHFFISTTVDVIVVTLLLRLISAQQRKLRAAEERYRAVYEQASDGIGVVSALTHQLIDVNVKLGQILGYQPKELIGRHFCGLLAAEEAPAGRDCNLPGHDIMEALVREGESETMIRSAYGAPLPVSVSCSTIPSGREKLFILTIRDLTERNRLEREKEQMQRQLFQASRMASLGELSAGVAHEINNPLNCIVNFAQLLKDDGVAGNDAERQMLDGIIEEGDRIARIVRDLLTFARQDLHQPTRVSLGELVPHSVTLFGRQLEKDGVVISVTLFGRQLEKDGIVIEVDVPEDLAPVLADSSRLRQVVVNMISNAHQALRTKQSDRKVFRISAREVDLAGRAMVRVEFFDNGEGISREILDKVFDPFFTTRRDSGGTGLGLSVSFGIIQDYRGTISVESEKGSHTRFVVHIPVAVRMEASYVQSATGG